jgi:hypothetical protein
MTPKSGYIFLFVFLSQVRHSTARIEWCKTVLRGFFFVLLSKRQEVQIERVNMQLFMCVCACVYIRKYRQGAHKTRWAIDTNTRHRELGPPDIYRLLFFLFFTLSTERNISTCYVVEKRVVVVGSTHI